MGCFITSFVACYCDVWSLIFIHQALQDICNWFCLQLSYVFDNFLYMLQVERVSHRDNIQSFVQKSENLEKQCLAKAIKSYCELRVLPNEENRTVVF